MVRVAPRCDLTLGMTSTANERLIYLDDVLGEEAYGNIEHRDGASYSLPRVQLISRLAISRSAVQRRLADRSISADTPGCRREVGWQLCRLYARYDARKVAFQQYR